MKWPVSSLSSLWTWVRSPLPKRSRICTASLHRLERTCSDRGRLVYLFLRLLLCAGHYPSLHEDQTEFFLQDSSGNSEQDAACSGYSSASAGVFSRTACCCVPAHLRDEVPPLPALAGGLAGEPQTAGLAELLLWLYSRAVQPLPAHETLREIPDAQHGLSAGLCVLQQ